MVVWSASRPRSRSSSSTSRNESEYRKVPAHSTKNQLGLGLSPLEDRRSDCLLHDLFRLPAAAGQSCNTTAGRARAARKSTPVTRTAARNVLVCQRPQGAWSWTRAPRGARPYRRSRLVVMPVSSRHTRWATSQVGAYVALGASRSVREAARQHHVKTASSGPEVTTVKHWLRWTARHKWVSRSLARDEWIAAPRTNRSCRT